MSARRKALKPQTVLAKENEDLSNEHRDVHPNYDDDAAQFGVRVADYNAGFLAGDENRKEQYTESAKLIIPVFQELSAHRKGKWSKPERRAWEKADRELRKYVKAV